MRLILLLPWLFFHLALAQPDTYILQQELPVTIDGRKLPMPLAGGLNAVQAGMLDVDADGKEDLVVYERFSQQILVFSAGEAGAWQYRPFLGDLFPAEVSDWMLLRDFNCDGKPDLFTGDPLGVRVFTNISTASTGLRWRQYHPGFPLLTKGFTANINLKINASDIPAIDDIDGDGDLDILATRFVGNSTIEYHKNLSMERTGTCDSLQLERITQNWGGVEECGCRSFAFDEPCPASSGRTQHTGGKTLFTIDTDGDGDKDLFFGEEECNQGFLLLNRGTGETAQMTDFSPIADASGQIFPSWSQIDGNLDGIPDLLFSTNISARSDNTDEFSGNIKLIPGTGTQPPAFGNAINGFLQNDMIDLGDQAFPAVFDMDGDGDEDLLAGTWKGGLSFFENTGSPGKPAFSLKSGDYLNLNQAGYYNIRPQFADLTADGIADLVFTATYVGTGTTQLYYIPNTIAPGFRGTAANITASGFGTGARDNILLYDLSSDGLPDIIKFSALGVLEYFRQSSTMTFIPENGDLYALGENPLRARAPLHITDIDEDGKEDLLIGLAHGTIGIWSRIRLAEREFSQVPVRNSRSGEITSPDLGGLLYPIGVQWFLESRPALLAGTVAGGFILLRPESVAPLPEQPVVSIYPNPVSAGQLLNIRSDRSGIVTIHSILGQRIGEPHLVPAGIAGPFPLPDLAPGVYLLRFTSGNRQKVLRLIRR